MRARRLRERTTAKDARSYQEWAPSRVDAQLIMFVQHGAPNGVMKFLNSRAAWTALVRDHRQPVATASVDSVVRIEDTARSSPRRTRVKQEGGGGMENPKIQPTSLPQPTPYVSNKQSSHIVM